MSERYLANYARISLEELKKKNTASIPAQLELNENYTKFLYPHLLKDYPIIQFKEQVSAKDVDKRDELKKILKDVKDGYCIALFVNKVDRLVRNVVDGFRIMELFTKKEAILKASGEEIDITTANGRFVYGIYCLIAQKERETVIENTARTQNKMFKDGATMSKPPYGYEGIKEIVEGKLKIVRWDFHPEESITIRRMFELYDKGYNLSQLSREFNMSRQIIRERLCNETYLGKRKFKGEVAEGDPNFHKALISDELFNSVQKRLNSQD